MAKTCVEMHLGTYIYSQINNFLYSYKLVILDTCTINFVELIICGLMPMNIIKATHTLSVIC